MCADALMRLMALCANLIAIRKVQFKFSILVDLETEIVSLNNRICTEDNVLLLLGCNVIAQTSFSNFPQERDEKRKVLEGASFGEDRQNFK